MNTKELSGFTQVDVKAGWDAISNLYQKNPTAGAIFIEMTKYMDASNGLIVSMAALGARVGKTRQTVAKACKFLKENKYIQVYKTGSSNVYVLNANIVWKDKHHKRVEAELYCNVLLNLNEQPNDIQEKARQLRLV